MSHGQKSDGVKLKNKNKIKPKYKQTSIGKIPVDWEVAKVKSVAYIDEENLTNTTNPQYKFNYISLSEVENGFLINKPKNVTFSNAPSRARRKVQKNDIILSTVRPNLMGYYYFKEECDNTVVSTGFSVITPKKKLSAKFFYHNLFSYSIQRQFYNLIVGSNYPAINLNDVKNLKIPFPSLSEQKEIAEILSTWDRAIDQTKKMIEIKELLKKGLMQQLLTGQIRFSEFGEPVREKGMLPMGWEIEPLDSFGSFLKGKGISNSEKKEMGIPCITYGEIYTKHDFMIKDFFSFINRRTTQESQKIKKNDILFAGSGETLEEIGKCVAFIKDTEAYAGGDIIIFRPTGVNPLYLSYSLNSDLLIKQKRKLGQGHSVVHIYSSGLKALQVLLPSCGEQINIVKVLSSCDKEIELLKDKMEKLKEQKKGLMQKLLMGEIRVGVKAVNE